MAGPRRGGDVPADRRSRGSARSGAHSSTAGRHLGISRGDHPETCCEAWSGLGYNRRALALREAPRERSSTARGACAVDDRVDSSRCPGIGPYTARAVAAAAFGVPVAPLDVNVRRGLADPRRPPGSARPGRYAAPAEAAAGIPGRRARRHAGRGSIGRWICGLDDCPARLSGQALVCGRLAPAAGVWSVPSRCATRRPSREARVTASVPFPVDTQWLRGRLVDRLPGRARPDEWVVICRRPRRPRRRSRSAWPSRPRRSMGSSS